MLNWEPVEFFQKGRNMTHFVKSEDDAANSKEFANSSQITKMIVTCSANLGNMIVKGIV